MTSETRKIKRGRLQIIWNDALKQYHAYRLSNREKWILTSINSTPSLTKRQMNKLTNI